ncbi:Heat shock 70 kDa protein cognate 4 [Nosema bombycis CQ1]|uniref:Heat shock 70 kDa protein cognate 4 n=1 Tax=Nosema bombycis (strain CQ1 / CVCC 102059) TaxID=578461 RepID=R0KV39_NOSB1|nr:Heat shock 70 kDa protein cognate 4 [Nosema bombycis CQ1]|eukprot:EOB14741.1 Heat shock 70 kDa protein cognate 4 [Nosema bombycis CQ1]
MEFIGIDLGAYKTVIASSKDNGKIITDEQGRRTIRTVLELTKPIRKFGNSITGDHELTIDLRHRDFFPKDLSNLYMWLKYIDRTIKKQTGGNPTICIAVPPYMGEVQRRALKSLCIAANMKVAGFFNDISAVGMFACIRREKTQPKFMIIDFGHHKTEIGVFSFTGNVFRPEYVKAIEVGAELFDKKLVDFIIHKYSLENKKIIREKIERSLEKVKTVLNASTTASVQFYLSETPLNVQITQEEFVVLIREDIEKITKFIDEALAETKFDGVADITGGNSSSFVIKSILDSRVKYQSTLDLTESCAIGSSLGFACSVIKSKFNISDVVGRDIHIGKTLLFKANDLLGVRKAVTYTIPESFDLEIFENDKPVSSIEILKNDKENDSVKITFEISKFGTVEIISVEPQNSITFKYKSYEIPEEDLQKILDIENEHREMEENIEIIGTMRNDLETMAMNLGDIISSKFENMFTEEEIDKIRQVGFDLFDVQQSTTKEEEEQVHKQVLGQYDFVIEKITNHWSKIKEELQQCRDKIKVFNSEHPKVFTPSFYKLQGLLYKIEDKINGEDVTLFNLGSYEFSYVELFKKDVNLFLKKSKEEIKKKLEDDKKAEEEKKAEEAKKAEEEKKADDSKKPEEEENKESKAENEKADKKEETDEKQENENNEKPN